MAESNSKQLASLNEIVATKDSNLAAIEKEILELKEEIKATLEK